MTRRSWPPVAGFAAAAAAHGALFILNDRPDLVEAAGADGVHVGQDDLTVARRARDRRPGPACRPLYPQPRADRRRAHRARRLHRGRPRPRDADQAGTPGRRTRARALRGRARHRPVLRDRRDLAGDRCCGPRRRRGPDRGRAGADRRAPTRTRPRARCAPRSPTEYGLAQRSSRKRGRRRQAGATPVATAPRPPQDAPASTPTPARPPSRSEARNAAVRATLSRSSPASAPGRSRSRSCSRC